MYKPCTFELVFPSDRYVTGSQEAIFTGHPHTPTGIRTSRQHLLPFCYDNTYKNKIPTKLPPRCADPFALRDRWTIV